MRRYVKIHVALRVRPIKELKKRMCRLCYLRQLCYRIPEVQLLCFDHLKNPTEKIEDIIVWKENSEQCSI
jgi:hypothetical protein